MGMYYSSHDLLTRNAQFNFVIGGRGTGKTYDAKKTRIKHFLKTGKEFIYLRRYKSEFDDKQSFFNDVAQEFDGYEFRVHGMYGYVRPATGDDVPDDKKPKWRLCVYFVTLSTALTKKSVPYPNVDYIVFDEFIIDKGQLHYLSKEVTAFQDFYNTVDRFTDRVRVLFLANAVSITNPYFIAFHLQPRKDRRFLMAHNGFMCVETVQSDEFRKHVDATRFGKMIKDTGYYAYAVGNEYADDNDRFICKKPETARFAYGLAFDGQRIGVWVDLAAGGYFITQKIPNNAPVFVLTKADMEPNLLMIEKTSGVLRTMRRLYMQGSVFFDSVQSRALFNDILDYLSLR